MLRALQYRAVDLEYLPAGGRQKRGIETIRMEKGMLVIITSRAVLEQPERKAVMVLLATQARLVVITLTLILPSAD